MRVPRIFSSLLFVLAGTWAQPAPRTFEVAAIHPAAVFNKFVEYSVAGPTVTFEVYDVHPWFGRPMDSNTISWS